MKKVDKRLDFKWNCLQSIYLFAYCFMLSVSHLLRVAIWKIDYDNVA